MIFKQKSLKSANDVDDNKDFCEGYIFHWLGLVNHKTHVFISSTLRPPLFLIMQLRIMGMCSVEMYSKKSLV